MMELHEEAFRKFCYCGRRLPKGYGPRPLSKRQEAIFNLLRVGWDPKQIANRMNMHESSIRDAIQQMKHKGYRLPTVN